MQVADPFRLTSTADCAEEQQLVARFNSQMRPMCPFPSCALIPADSLESKIISGGTYQLKYKWFCKQCGKKWQQRRQPIITHTGVENWEVTESKCAAPFEAPTKQYACGKCGAKPKKNHICPYRDTDPTDMFIAHGLGKDNVSLVEAQVNKTLLEANVAIQTATRFATPGPVPKLVASIAPAFHGAVASDAIAVTAAPALHDAVEVDAIAVTAPIAPALHDAVDATAPALHDAVEVDAIAVTAPTASALHDAVEVDATAATAPVTPALFGGGKGPPHAGSVLTTPVHAKASSTSRAPPLDAPTCPSLTEMPASAVSAPVHSPALPPPAASDNERDSTLKSTTLSTSDPSTLKSTTLSTSDPQRVATKKRARDDESATFSYQIASEEPGAAEEASTLTDTQVHKRLRLTRLKVKGDGSCWVYAALAPVGACDHANSKRERTPSQRDCERDLACRMSAFEWLQSNGVSMLKMTPDELQQAEDILKLPVYSGTRCVDFGAYGSDTTIAALTGVLQVTIVVWNATNIGNKACKQQVFEYIPVTERVRPTLWNHEKILSYSSQNDTIHIEWNGHDHYASLVHPSPVLLNSKDTMAMLGLPQGEAPSKLGGGDDEPMPHSTDALLERASNRIDEGSVDEKYSWDFFEDKVRVDAKICEEVLAYPATDKELARLKRRCIRKGCTAIILIDNKYAKLVKFDFPITIHDCATPGTSPPGNFVASMHVLRTSKHYVKAKAPPFHCTCGIYYNNRRNLIECSSCKRLCHEECTPFFLRSKKVKSQAVHRCSACQAAE
jgi:hypothetical protein